MGRVNAEPSAKTSEEHSWKTLPGLILSLMSRKAQNRSISIQVLFMECFSNKIISRKYPSSYWKMLISKILQLDFSASIHILQLNTVFTLWLQSLFFLAISENVFTKLCLFESTSDIYCCKDSRDQKQCICSLQLETELVCWQGQYPKLENT